MWGVILPVGLLSLIGWFWFRGDVIQAAWNPHGLSLGKGDGLQHFPDTVAFLRAWSLRRRIPTPWKNPKKNVPLACMFGTLGAAVIYILSTTVIQGIVPNAELARSTAPFSLVFAKMFNPTIGSIVLALALLACLGSLLGWQFTIAQTGSRRQNSACFHWFFPGSTAWERRLPA